MFRFKKPNLDTQQWVLYSLLVVSLGFNLSMNPEHFTNFARNEMKTTGFTELAQTAAEAKGKTRDMGEIEGKRGRFKVTIVEVDSVTVARFQKVDGATDTNADNSTTAASSPATDCELCSKPVVLSSGIDKVYDLSIELNAILNDGKASVQAKTEEVKPQKAGEATEADLEAYAKKCEQYEDDEESESRLECHKKQILALSKFLKNSKETEDMVLQYYKEHIQGDLQKAFKAQTYKKNDFNFYEPDSSELEFAQQFSEDLISALRPQNGKSTVRAITKLNSNAYLYQLENAKNLIRKGEQTGNMQMVNAGMQGMNPILLRSLLNTQQESLSMAIDGMVGYKGNDMAIKESLINSLSSTFYNPVDTTLKDLQNFIAQPSTNGQTKSWADFVITSSPYLNNESIVSADPFDHQLAMDTILGRGSFRGNQHALLWSSNPGGIPTPMATPNYNQTPDGSTVTTQGIPSPTGAPVTPRSARGRGNY